MAVGNGLFSSNECIWPFISPSIMFIVVQGIAEKQPFWLMLFSLFKYNLKKIKITWLPSLCKKAILNFQH